jgi:hypothetical protein
MYTENNPLGHLYKMCYLFFDESQVVLSVKVFSSSAVLLEHIQQTPKSEGLALISLAGGEAERGDGSLQLQW